MQILCTNDDGVFSPGLAAAVEAAGEFGEVSVVAPSSQKTGAGRSLMGERRKPLSTVDISLPSGSVRAWQLDGTPAFVVRHALATVFRGKKFDLAISGINYGENMAYDISTSGTVGAAVECAVKGIPGIAVSVQTGLDGHHEYGRVDWSATQFFLRQFIRRFIEKRGFTGFDVLKIDVPMDADRRTPWEACRLQRSPYYRARLKNESDEAVFADSQLYVDTSPFAPGTDAHVLAVEKKVAVVPLVLDWTARETGGFFTEDRQARTTA